MDELRLDAQHGDMVGALYPSEHVVWTLEVKEDGVEPSDVELFRAWLAFVCGRGPTGTVKFAHVLNEKLVWSKQSKKCQRAAVAIMQLGCGTSRVYTEAALARKVPNVPQPSCVFLTLCVQLTLLRQNKSFKAKKDKGDLPSDVDQAYLSICKKWPSFKVVLVSFLLILISLCVDIARRLQDRVHGGT